MRMPNQALHNGLAPASLPPAGERYVVHKKMNMNFISNILKYGILIAVSSIIIWFYVWPYLILLQGPFTYDEIDLDKSGIISPSEAQYHYDHGERKIVKGGEKCTEYYALKDGIELKTVCEEKK